MPLQLGTCPEEVFTCDTAVGATVSVTAVVAVAAAVTATTSVPIAITQALALALTRFRMPDPRIYWPTQWRSNPQVPCNLYLLSVLHDVTVVFVSLPVSVFVYLPDSASLAVSVSVPAAESVNAKQQK